jgi:hypothetical protein
MLRFLWSVIAAMIDGDTLFLSIYVMNAYLRLRALIPSRLCRYLFTLALITSLSSETIRRNYKSLRSY